MFHKIKSVIASNDYKLVVKDEEGKDKQISATNFDIILTLNGNNVTGCTITASENIEKYYGVLKNENQTFA